MKASFPALIFLVTGAHHATSQYQLVASFSPPPIRQSGCPVAKDKEDAAPGTTYVYRMAAEPPNAHYEKACGTDVRFNDPCKWARGEAQITVAQFTNMCKGATRMIHWHDGADEWGYVNHGVIRTYVASPDGLPWPNSNKDITKHGVWYFPRGWLHGLLCLTPASEGGCVVTIFFSGPVSVPIDNHNLDTTFAQAPDDIAAAALKQTTAAYQKMRPAFSGSAGPVNSTDSSSPLVTMVAKELCEPACPPIVETKALPAAMNAADVEKFVQMQGGVKLYQIRTDTFQFAATMSQERTELPPGSFRSIVWVSNADGLLMVTSGNVTLGLQGGRAGSSNEHDAHKAWTEIGLVPGDIAYFPVGRAYWFKEATGVASASTITVFNVGTWRSVELADSTALMPDWAVKSNLRQNRVQNSVIAV